MIKSTDYEEEIFKQVENQMKKFTVHFSNMEFQKFKLFWTYLTGQELPEESQIGSNVEIGSNVQIISMTQSDSMAQNDSMTQSDSKVHNDSKVENDSKDEFIDQNPELQQVNEYTT